jgi:cellulose biosynthesis protein BcsQ
MKTIAMFNHKGGVSKTTTSFNLGWKLAQKGHKVLLVDADPQCNLTGLILDFSGPDAFDEFYQAYPTRNIKAGLAPAFEGRPEPITAVQTIQVPGNDRLFLMPGSIQLAENEVTLSIANELSGSIQALKNVPGSLSTLFGETARAVDAEFVIVDMNPSLSAINQVLFLSSDYFIMPCSPDYFSLMAIKSFDQVAPRWHDWQKRASENSALSTATYRMPTKPPVFLGTIIQNFRPRENRPAVAFQKWVDQIEKITAEEFFPTMKRLGMTLPEQTYRSVVYPSPFNLSLISDFNTLIAYSQQHRKPVYTLTQEEVQRGGAVWDRTKTNIDRFDQLFSSLADKIVTLTGPS